MSSRSSLVPPRGTVPDFAPIRAGGGRGRMFLRRGLHRRRRLLALGLAVTAAATAGMAPRGDGGAAREGPSRESRGDTASAASVGAPHGGTVSAPVRIADAAAVALLEPGDRVDVIATGDAGPPQVVARGARVELVPGGEDGGPHDGALVVLEVPRGAATQLAGAAAGSRLAVTLR